MKIDSEFIKQILTLIENQEDYVMSSHALMKSLHIEGRDLERKFMGHILLLGDNDMLESFSTKYPFGFVYCAGGEYSIMDVGYRLTAKGYEMLDFYNNNEICQKITDCTLSNAYNVAKKYFLGMYR